MKTFLTGVGIGVGLGILLAPDRGEATRRKLRGRIHDLSDSLSEQVDRAKETVADQAERLSQQVTGIREGDGDARGSKKPQATAESFDDLSINMVSREELMTVNGIGPVLADRIISGRPYSSIEDFANRGIIAQSTYEELERQFGRGRRRSA